VLHGADGGTGASEPFGPKLASLGHAVVGLPTTRRIGENRDFRKLPGSCPAASSTSGSIRSLNCATGW
jgi:hypothetical protein